MIRHYRTGFGALNCPVLCRVHGPLDTTALGSAVDALVSRHESLRTTFTGRGARLTQVVHDPAPLPLPIVDLGTRPDPETAVREAIGVELATPIDPQVWPARAGVWRLSDTEHVLCLNLHHLVTDAWSTGILLRDLTALFDRAVGGGPPPAPPSWQYRDFVAWQQRLLGGDELRRHQDYWRRQLAGAQLPRLRPVLDGAGQPAGRSVADVDAEVVRGVHARARSGQTTLFAVLLAGFHAHLARVTGQPDLAVASMFANRARPELRGTVGLLANMVLLRCPAGASRSDLLAGTHASVIGAFAYQDLPYQMLPTDLVRATGGRPDDVMFNVMAGVEHRIAAGGVEFELLVPDDIGSRFPFELALTPIGTDRVRCVLFHAGGWCSPAAAREFLRGYLTTLTELAEKPLATR
jgi:hypothetical protein